MVLNNRSVCCLMWSEQSFSNIMARTCCISISWWGCQLCTRPTH